MVKFWQILGVAVCGLSFVRADEVVLVAPDQPTPAIVISPQAADQERFAAEDLRKYLGQMTGREFSLTEQVPTEGKAIYLGAVAGNDVLQQTVKEKKLGRDGFILDVSPGAVRIVGGSKFGVSYGAYELLEQLGVRWFFPGQWGEVVPRQETLRLKTGQTADQPVFPVRQMHAAWVDREAGDWFRRNRHNRSGFYGHSRLIDPAKYAEAHPEWYAEIDGVRQVDDPNYKLCHSNPEMVAKATEEVLEEIRRREQDTKPRVHIGYEHLAEDYSIISISPTDGGGFCRCAQCEAMGSVSDRLRIFANRIAGAVRQEFPGYSVGYYGAYSEHQAPPVVQAEPGVVVVPTTWTKNFFKPISDQSNQAFRDKLNGFVKNAPRMILRDYDGLAVWWGYGPLSLADVHAADYQWYQEHGLEGIITEAGSGWGPWGYSYYLMGKLWWNPHADLTALKKDFVQKAYGEAAEPMKTYYEALDRSVIHPDPADLFLMRQKLEEAAKLAVDPGVKKRVNYLRAHYYLEDLYEKYRAGEARPGDVELFYRILTGIDPSVSPFSRCRRYLKVFPKQPANIHPVSESELEEILATVQLTPPGKSFAAWLDLDDLRLEPAPGAAGEAHPESLGLNLRFGPATLLIYARAGEAITVRQTAKRWDKFDTAYELQTPELVTLADGVAGEEVIVDTIAPSSGIYTLTLSPGGRYPEIHVSNQHAVVKASSKSQSVHPMGRVSQAYLYVPEGTREFAIVSRAYEPLTLQVDGPMENPNPRPVIEQKAQVFQQHNITVAPGEDGKIWRLSLGGGKKDLYLAGIPPFFSNAPDRLLIPPMKKPAP